MSQPPLEPAAVGTLAAPNDEESVLIGSPPVSPEPLIPPTRKAAPDNRSAPNNQTSSAVSRSSPAAGGVPNDAEQQPPPAAAAAGAAASAVDTTSEAAASGNASSAPPDGPPMLSTALEDLGSREANVSFYSTKKERAVWRMIEYGVSSEQGTRKTMEDQHKAMLSTDLVTPRDPTAPRAAIGIPFFGVYDGHGGPQCAEFLRQHLHTFVLSHPHVREDPEKAIQVGVEEAERLFMEKCRTERIESGSTVAVALIVDDTLVVGNVGDSEIVLSRGGIAKVLTVKHTLGSNESEVERVKACGGRIFHARVGHPKFNPMLVSLAVSRAVGDAGFKLEEYTDGKPSGLIAEAETCSVELDTSDEFIIIGCDGLWDVLSYQAAVDFCQELIRNGQDTQQVTEQLCQEALRLGSTDNVTALFVSLKIRPKSGGSTTAARPASAASIHRLSGMRAEEPAITDFSPVPLAATPPPHAAPRANDEVEELDNQRLSQSI